MSQEKVFGRRATPRAAPPPVAPSSPVRDLPTLKDLGFTPTDDKAELREFKRGYRHRRFVGQGAWRWVSGVCMGVSALFLLLDLHLLGWLAGIAAFVFLIYSFTRHAKSLDGPAGTS